ncbi:MAG: ferredoxin reductase [Acidimicrobiia bacterium]
MWRPVTVAAGKAETARARTLTLLVPDWTSHRPGQHVDVRLTADDGYQAVRSYSIASAPESPTVDLTVELVDDGEVSSYLVEEARAGDAFEVRGPLGGYFVWTVDDGGPLFLVAGGSGLVPLMSMLRHRRARCAPVFVRALVSARALGDLLYADELVEIGKDDAAEVQIALTRDAPPDWAGHTRRIDREMLAEAGWAPNERPRVYVCGPTGFVETAGALLVDLGHDAGRIRTERFGPTGG